MCVVCWGRGPDGQNTKGGEETVSVVSLRAAESLLTFGLSRILNFTPSWFSVKYVTFYSLSQTRLPRYTADRSLLCF